jgi:ubiquitin-protein ligase
MSENNKLKYNLENLLESYKFINNIKLLAYFVEDDIYNIKIEIDNNTINIISDFIVFCYIESSLYNTEKINNLILYNKIILLENILIALDSFDFEESKVEQIIYNDSFHFYNKIEEKTKIFIDYNQLDILKKSQSDNIYNNIVIPKGLLLNNKQIYQLILNEIKNINSNYNHSHTIVPIDNNIYILKAKIFLNNIDIELKITLNSNLYPFYPPELEIIAPKVSLPLYYAIKNLNIIKLNNWNSAISLEWIINNLSEKLKPIINEHIEIDKVYLDIELAIFNFSNLVSSQLIETIDIDLDIPKKDQVTENKYWKAGIGYGTGSGIKTQWNINNYIKKKELLNIEITNSLIIINSILNNENIIYLENSLLLSYILNITSGINLLEIENDYIIFNEFIKILSKIILFDNFKIVINEKFINSFLNNMSLIFEEIILLFQSDKDYQNNELYQGINSIFIFYSDIIIPKKNIKPVLLDYCNIMQSLQFGTIDIASTHLYYAKKNIIPNRNALKRIISEISSFKTGLPLNYESTIWLRISMNHMNLFSFIISGPKDTPYENGLFEFHVFLPENYPLLPPEILLSTTGNGSVRFNPNLYNNGKVCLSLLGTWSGDESEKWNAKTSTFLQVLVSIQSLIFVEDPYFNEPGYEKEINTVKGHNNNNKYNNKLKIETIRWAMINIIQNPPLGYEEIVKKHFELKKDYIINQVDNWLENTESICKKDLKIEIDILKNLLNLLN